MSNAKSPPLAGVLLGKTRLDSVYGLKLSPFFELRLYADSAGILGLQTPANRCVLSFTPATGCPVAGLAKRV
jgi:hypothetical protein